MDVYQCKCIPDWKVEYSSIDELSHWITVGNDKYLIELSFIQPTTKLYKTICAPSEAYQFMFQVNHIMELKPDNIQGCIDRILNLKVFA